MTIYCGADHGGYQLKEILKLWLQQQNYSVEDCGATQLDPKDDYPDFAFAVAKKVVQNPESIGILLCRSGGGMVIAANRIKGIRAVNIHDEKGAVHAKTNNNANIVSLEADWLGDEQAKQVLSAFLKAKFAGEERHVRRIGKIGRYLDN